MVNARSRFSVRVWVMFRVRAGVKARASVSDTLWLGLGQGLVLGLVLGNV